MEWIEFIKVRRSGSQDPGEVSILFNRAKVHLEPPGLIEANVYAHASIPGDLCLTLAWNTDRPRPEGSVLALSLVQEFRRSGLVDHTVWIKRDERSAKE